MLCGQGGVSGFQLLEKREGLALAPGKVENPCLVRLDGGGRRIKFARLLDLVESFGKAPRSEQICRVPVMSLDEVWVEFERAFEFAFGGYRIPLPVEGGKRQGIV